MTKTKDQITKEAREVKAHIDAAENALTDENFSSMQKYELRNAFREIGKAIVKAI